MTDDRPAAYAVEEIRQFIERKTREMPEIERVAVWWEVMRQLEDDIEASNYTRDEDWNLVRKPEEEDD